MTLAPAPRPQFLRLSGGVVVTAYRPNAAGGGILVHLVGTQLQPAGLDVAMRRLLQDLGGSWTGAVVKLVGPSALTQLVRTHIEAAQGHTDVVVERDGPQEVVFYPETGRLRLARPELAAASPVAAVLDAVPPAAARRKRLLIVDDSPTIQRLLSQIFSAQADFEVVGVTGEPRTVADRIAQHQPDVMTLDIHMPGMDGVEVLRQIMPRCPVPTVMITSLSLEEGGKVLDALEAGAVDYVQKPAFATLQQQAEQIVERVRAAATAKVRAPTLRPLTKVAEASIKPGVVVLIGSSTGGTEALREILTRLPANIPPILIVQHIPPVFSAALAARLDSLCPFKVSEATHRAEVLPNQVFIAPGGKHMRLVRSGDRLTVTLDESPPHNRHRPAVDLLFDSAAALMPKQTVGIILTGMGADGAKGLLTMRQGGAHTIAQDEKSCVVYGMPKEAVKLGAAEQVLDLLAIPNALMKLVSR